MIRPKVTKPMVPGAKSQVVSTGQTPKVPGKYRAFLAYPVLVKTVVRNGLRRKRCLVPGISSKTSHARVHRRSGGGGIEGMQTRVNTIGEIPGMPGTEHVKCLLTNGLVVPGKTEIPGTCHTASHVRLYASMAYARTNARHLRVVGPWQVDDDRLRGNGDIPHLTILSFGPSEAAGSAEVRRVG